MQVVVVAVVGRGPLLDPGLLLSFNGVHRLVSEVLMLYCPFQLVWYQIVTWVGTSRSQKSVWVVSQS
jgi:hypothetical protein